MSRGGPRSAWGLAGWCTRATTGGGAEAGEVYQLGFQAGSNRAGVRFAEGFRAGAVIGRRLAEGDDALRCALRELLDDGGLDA